MKPTERDFEMFMELRERWFCTARQLQRWCFLNDKDGSTTRERLRKNEAAGYVRRLKAEVHDPFTTPSAPVWNLTQAGSCLLAMHKGDPSLILDFMTNTRNWTSFRHYVEVAELTKDIDLAFAKQTYAEKGRWYFEHEIISDATDPERRYRNYVFEQNGDRRIVCNCDVRFQVKVGSFCNGYYIEHERGLESPKRIVAKKTPGYSIMDRHFQRHFPEAQTWRAFFVLPNAAFRDAVRKAADPLKTRNWLFVARPDINENFLHQPVVYTATDGPRPFIKPPVTP